MGTLTSGSIDLNSLKEAGKPNNYITYVTADAGIRIARSDPSQNDTYTAINGDTMSFFSEGKLCNKIYKGGMKLFDGTTDHEETSSEDYPRDPHLIAEFTEGNVILGKEGKTGQLNLTEDSLRLSDANGVDCFYIDSNVASIPTTMTRSVESSNMFPPGSSKYFAVTSSGIDPASISTTFEYIRMSFPPTATVTNITSVTARCTLNVTSSTSRVIGTIIPTTPTISGNGNKSAGTSTSTTNYFQAQFSVTFNNKTATFLLLGGYKIANTSSKLELYFKKISGDTTALGGNSLGIGAKIHKTFTAGIPAPAYTIGDRRESGNNPSGFSVTMGHGLQSDAGENKNYKVVMGTYNNDLAGNILEIGRGTGPDDCKNALSIDTNGNITIREHAGPIGDISISNNGTGSTTMSSYSSGSNYSYTGCNVTLTPGVYILIGRISYGTGTTGRRIAAWGTAQNNIVDHSLVSCSPVSGANTNVQSVAIVLTNSTSTYYLLGRQTQGSSLEVSSYCKVIRIR